MKKLLLIIILSNCISNTFSQAVVKNIDFDNYISATENDLTDNFHDGTGFTQLSTGGITGGAITCPNSASINEQFTYIKSLNNFIGVTNKASICFKYNSTLINSGDFQYAVALNFEYPDYIFFYLDKNKTLNINSYNWIASNSGDEAYPTLIDNNWYLLEGSVNIIGGTSNDELYLKAEIFNLGATGQSAPVSVGIADGTINYTNYVSSTKVNISAWGTQWGGSSLLDNFSVEGEPKALHNYSFSINPTYTAGLFGSFTLNSLTPAFNSTNEFTFQLSDKDGSFDNPTNLLTFAGIYGGGYNQNFPNTLPTGTNYKIRTISSSPIDTSNESNAFTINASFNSTTKSTNIESLQFYPNPTTGIIQYASTANVSEIKILDLYGKEIYKNSDVLEKIDMTTLSKGVYTLELTTSEGKFVEKIIKE